MSTTEAARKPTPTTWLDATSNSTQPARQCLSHQCCHSQKKAAGKIESGELNQPSNKAKRRQARCKERLSSSTDDMQ